jgi:hypothetical protein
MQRWIHLNKFIAHTLGMSFDDWIERFVTPSFDAPLDYSFMSAVIAGAEGLGLEGKGVSFSREMDPALRAVSRVPLRAKNNLGRLSPDLQDRLSAMLAGEELGPVKLLPADVTLLQKILPGEKTLAKLAKPLFRKLELTREDDDLVLSIAGGDEVVRLNVMELGGALSRPLL